MMPRMRCPSFAFFLMLAGLVVMGFPPRLFAQGFQPVVSLACPQGPFVVDARPFSPNEAGSSQVDVRYRYRGLELNAINYEAYYKNLDAYLHEASSTSIKDFGLRLDTSGASKTSGYDVGDTLHMSPATFSRSDFDHLAACIASHQAQLRQAFAQADISTSALLGLFKTHTTIPRTDIARLVYGEPPVTAIYGDAWYLVLVERQGRVVLRTNYTGNNAAQSVVIGQVTGSRAGKQLIHATPAVTLSDQTFALKDLLKEQDRHGRALGDDYLVLSP